MNALTLNNILIVDDDEHLLLALSQALSEEGYRVLATSDGPTGVQIFKEKKPEIVLLDLGLPTMNGIDVLRQIRTIDQSAKVVIITGYGAKSFNVEALNAGATAFLEKPVDFKQLIGKLKEALGTSGE